MQAIVCTQYGPPDLLKLASVPRPEIAENEVRVRTFVAGINFPDSLIITGEYQLKPPMPFVPGFELAGEVVELGSKVSNLRIGQRVMALTSQGYGAFAEEASAKAADVVRIPGGLDYSTATALFVAYGTAYHGLVQRGRLAAGENLVVLGASGAVGLAAVEIGKALGATVIAISSTRARAAAALDKGADHAIGYAEEDVRNRVLELTGGKGADVCIDMLGGDPFHALSRSMNWDGRLLVVGFTTGDIPKLAVNLPLLKGYQLVGVYWGPFMTRYPEVNAENFDVLAKWHAEGTIRPHIEECFPLAEVPQALEKLLSRRTVGKLLIDVRSHAGGNKE